MPGPELRAHRVEDPDGFEPDAAVERDTCLVGQRDPGERIAETLPRELLEKRQVERAPDSLAMRSRSDVSGGLDGPAIGRALAMHRSVGIAQATALVLGDEPRPARERLGDAGGKLLYRGRLDLERDDGVFDERPVEGQQRGRVGKDGGSDCRRAAAGHALPDSRQSMKAIPSATTAAIPLAHPGR